MGDVDPGHLAVVLHVLALCGVAAHEDDLKLFLFLVYYLVEIVKHRGEILGWPAVGGCEV